MSDRERLDTAIRTATSIAVNLLVAGEYPALEAITGAQLLTASQLRAAVEQYGRTLVLPPREAWEEIDAVQARGAEQVVFHVVVPLWTEEEGRSDLTLELQLAEGYPGTLDTKVVDLHVL